MSDAKQSDVQLNDAFKRLEAQVAENQSAQPKSGRTESGTRERPTPAAGGGVSGLLGILLALIALGVASFAAYNTWQLQESARLSTESQQVSELSGRVSMLSQQLDLSKQDIAGLISQMEATSTANDATLLAMEERVAGVVAELRQQLGTTSEDWLLAEAEYLLRLANQRVAMEDDVSGAIGLFQAADQIVREAEGVVAFDLREAIARDVAALRGVSSADVQGIFVELGAVADQIDQLQQKRLRYTPPAIEDDNSTPAEQGAMDKIFAFLSRLGQRLGTLVDYRNDGESIKPILPPEEEYYLKQNLALKLQLAQLGLLRGNQSIYEQSLQDSIEWVDGNFSADSAVTQSVRESLTRLAAIDVSRNLPDVSGSLREIRKLMTQFHQAADRVQP